MKRKSLVLLLVMMLMSTFTLYGCGGAGNTTQSSTQETSQETAQQGEKKAPAKVDIFQNKSEFAEQLEAAAKLYMEENPEVQINIETVQGADYATALKAKMLNDDKPEIFGIAMVGVKEDYGDYQEDLSDQPWVEHLYPDIKETVTVDGKVLGLPVSIEGYGLAYNREIFEAAGIDCSTLTSYDAIDKAFATLQQKIDNGELKDKYPQLEAVVEYAAKEAFISGLHLMNIPLQAELKTAKAAFEAQEIELTHADSLKALIDLQTNYTPARNNKSLLNSVDYSTQVGGGLAIERVAVIQQGNWIAPELANVAPDVLEKIDVMPIPLKGVVEDSIAVGVSFNWCVNNQASDADKAAAKDFLNWLFQSEKGKQIVIEELKCIPAFDNYEDLDRLDPYSKRVAEYMGQGKTMPWVFSGYPKGFEPQAAADIQGYFAGDMTWEECVQKLKEDWKTLR
ncbi:MAG: carbohydrate ABC transporter substrate-binding protein [Epulopiscium sp.]|nr:carbohydrate ABC transporter substrate-binding protein [Candidatus Epulonipiscium sp.]